MRQVNLTLCHAKPGQPTGIARTLMHCKQNRFGLVVQQLGIGERSWRHHTYHLALDRALAGGHIAHLLANCHRFAELDELGQIAFK